jgi:hypothetical protein
MNRPRAVDITARSANPRVFILSSFVHLAVFKRRKSTQYREVKGCGLYLLRLAAIASFEMAAASHAYGAEKHVIKQIGSDWNYAECMRGG